MRPIKRGMVVRGADGRVGVTVPGKRRPIIEWLADLAWAVTMVRARRVRRGLTFGQQWIFDDVVRPWGIADCPLEYPVAGYVITAADVRRAEVAAKLFAASDRRRERAEEYLRAERNREVEAMHDGGWWMP